MKIEKRIKFTKFTSIIVIIMFLIVNILFYYISYSLYKGGGYPMIVFVSSVGALFISYLIILVIFKLNKIKRCKKNVRIN